MAAVAPLGTALTEEQLGADLEAGRRAIVCFDGDKAGSAPPVRAVDMAMPRLKPGKSLRFAMLPDGQDPDDLFRSRRPRSHCRSARRARGRSGEMLWSRETEAGLAGHAGAPRRLRGQGA